MAKTVTDSGLGKRCPNFRWRKEIWYSGADHRDHGTAGRLHPGGLPCERVSGDG